MRFVQFAFKEAQRSTFLPRLGVMKTDSIITDISTLFQESPTLVSALRNLGPDTLKQKTSELLNKSDYDVPLHDVDLLAPVTSPDKVACVGMNYKDHCEEQGSPVPKEPVFFNKFPSCIIGPYDAIPYPSVSEQLDWEVELAIVIGRKGKNIDVNSAYDYIFGYTVAHDVSARDWQLQKNGGQWFLGKTMDGFCPLGPCVVTSDNIKDPHDLKISCRVNGETKQNSSTNQMVHRCDAVVSFLSKFCTLLPGDVILTGTPPGVGVFAKPPQFLKPGDIVECEIEQIGLIRNSVA